MRAFAIDSEVRARLGSLFIALQKCAPAIASMRRSPVAACDRRRALVCRKGVYIVSCVSSKRRVTTKAGGSERWAKWLAVGRDVNYALPVTIAEEHLKDYVM